tara:strand:+ start:4867 stop:5373 length:507 start_codon:yes stop_codon:yes gene_type:complete
MAIDATIAGTSSDSYITVATADAYHATHLYVTTWTAATTDNKERSLKMATRLLDERITWRGTKNTDAQALRWPRASVTDNDLYSVAVDIIPEPIQNATAEFARHLLVSDLTAQPEGKGIESVDAGSVSIKFSKTDTADVLPVIVQEMLRGWGTIHSRAKFGSVTVVRT